MLFGLANTLVTFQHLMETCLGNPWFWWCIIYLDDVIAFVVTPKEHLQRLQTVLSQLWEAGLKLQPAKCECFKTSQVYLGQKISKEGVWTDDSKVEAIQNWPIPSTVNWATKLFRVYELLLSFYKGVCRGHPSSSQLDFWGQCNPKEKKSYVDGEMPGSL